MSWLSGGPAHTHGSRVAGPLSRCLFCRGAVRAHGQAAHVRTARSCLCCGGSIEELRQLGGSFANLRIRALGNSEFRGKPYPSSRQVHGTGCSGSSAPPSAERRVQPTSDLLAVPAFVVLTRERHFCSLLGDPVRGFQDVDAAY